MSQLLNPPYSLNEPFSGINNVIEEIQSSLNEIPWLQYSFGRVKPQKVDGKLEPWILRSKQDKEYYRAYPNDTLKSFSCLYAHDDETYIKDIFVKRTLSTIVWVNSKSIEGNITLEEMKKDVRDVLRELYCVMELGESKDQTSDGPQAIYPGFDMSGFEERYLTAPYAGFRIECVTQWADLCC